MISAPAEEQENLENDYDGQDFKFTYKPFTVTPSFCQLTVACTSVTSDAVGTGIACDDDTNVAVDDLTFNFDH